MVRGGSKLEKELKQDEDGTILMPVESLPVISETVAKKAVKRELTEKQKENAKKLGEASRARWEKLREEKARLKAEQEAKEKDDEKKLIEAGTHVRVKVAKKPRGKAVKKEIVEKQNTPKPQRRYISNETTDNSSDDDDSGYTETEEDTELESDVEPVKPRRIRREVKKNLKVLQKVDEVLQQQPSNHYITMLQGRWR